MPRNSRAIIGAFLSLAVLYLAGVVLLLDPIAVGDAPTGPLIPLPMAFVIAIAVYVALFVWVEQRMRSPFSAQLAPPNESAPITDVRFTTSASP